MAKRCFYTGYAGDPYFNMAFDEWLFAKACESPGSILLRLYTWNRGAVTFGYNQKPELALHLDRLGDTPVIRRVTGGRALYHEPSELTYSIAVNTLALNCDRLSGSISRTTASIAGALAEFVQQQGIECEFLSRSSEGFSNPDTFHKAPCFASRARYEIVSGGQKIVASAQRRIENTIFQHGSIKIGGVVSHPAVPLALKGGAAEAETVGPVAAEPFNRLAATFRSIFQSFVGCELGLCEPDEEGQAALEKRRIRVKDNFLQRRDIF